MAVTSRSVDEVDPVDLSILWSRLIAIVDEAAAALYRTSFSPVVRESNDYACVLLDPLGQSLVQSTLSIPSFIGTLPRTVRKMLEVFPPDSLGPGDVVISNDPWLGTGHLNDINVMVPIFRRGDLVALAASTAHAPDIGGRPISLDNREVFEEGLRIPVSKFFARGTENDSIMAFIQHNVRVPEEVIGDLLAQVAANELAGRRVGEFLDEYGLFELTTLANVIHKQSEAATRNEIRALPEAHTTRQMMIEGLEGADLRLVLTLVLNKDAGTITCDYTGTSPQQPAAFNVVPNYTFAYTAFAVKCVVAPRVPNNEGCLRPLSVMAPDGTLLNPRFPAAVGARSLIGHYLPALVFDALSDVAPGLVRAAAGSPNWAVLLSGESAARGRFADIFFYNGGMGGARGQDGHSCICFPSNVGSTPLEVLEQRLPIRFTRQELAPDSAGIGQWRGGFGQLVEFVVTDATTLRVSLWTSHTRHPAGGLCGGNSGSVGTARINGHSIDTSKILNLRPGDYVSLVLPGGGGFGASSERATEATAQDATSGLISCT